MEKWDIVLYSGSEGCVREIDGNVAWVQFNTGTTAEFEWIQISDLTVIRPLGGMPPERLAEKRHIEALRAVMTRNVSYVEAMEQHGYQSEISLRGSSSVLQTWDQVLMKDGVPVYATIFLQDNRDGQRGVCPHRAICPHLSTLRASKEGSSIAETLLMWRCGVRWSDISDCPEGPEYQPKLTTATP